MAGEHLRTFTRDGLRRAGQPPAVVIHSIITNAGHTYDIGSLRGKSDHARRDSVQRS